MTLTVVVGSSGSGKTTFLNDVYKSHKCIYIRQYHMMRSYIPVCKIPNFDPTKLPFWKTYEAEGKASSIKVGGTMAGEFTAGLSGGQRKLLLFELICQRTKNQSDLLIALDEPFCGVTDDFVPYLVGRLNEIRQTHNILLVTNDHVETLTSMADNTITVSAIDRSVVKVNDGSVGVDREKTILALSTGEEYTFTSTTADLRFFFDVEVLSNGALQGIAMFTTFCNLLFVASFWNSAEDQAALVLVAGGIISFFCVNPYLLGLTEWRNTVLEEAEALMHASKGMNKILKTLLTLTLIVTVSVIEFGVVNAVINGLESVNYWIAMLFDSVSLTVPVVWLGLYTRLPFQAVDILGSMPFLLMIFLSTTFSPGSGIPVLKELRYLFSRFYFWCMLPGTQDLMEGCPPEDVNMLYLVLSGLLTTIAFLVAKIGFKIQARFHKAKMESKRASMVDEQYMSLQSELYGDKSKSFSRHSKATTTRTASDNDDVTRGSAASVQSNSTTPPPSNV